MSQWIPLIIVAMTYALILCWTWWAIQRERTTNRLGAYERGYEDGWKRHTGAHRWDEPEYDQGFTAGWCALLDALDANGESPRATKAAYDDGRAEGWQEALDSIDLFGVHKEFPL
jgi:hypothetical protein